jgi:hypothetical protein
MNEERLVERLAVQVMGWRKAPGRYLKAGRTWIPSWRFAPLTTLEDAFKLLAASDSTYTLRAGTESVFEAEVHVRGCVGKAFGEPKARTITLALVRALGLDDIAPTSEAQCSGNQASRSKRDV